MHTLSKRLNRWLNIWLVFTLVGSLLSPVPLAAASPLEPDPSVWRSNDYSRDRSQRMMIDPVPTSGGRAKKDMADSNPTLPAQASVPAPHPFSLPFDSSLGGFSQRPALIPSFQSSWSPPVLVSSNIYGAPAVAILGNLAYTVWAGPGSDLTAQLFLATSTDGGQTWSPSGGQQIPISTAEVDTNPAIVVNPNGGDIYVAYVNDEIVYLIHSNNGGQNWSQIQNITSYLGRFNLAIDGNGYLYLLLYDTTRTYILNSQNQGQSWQTSLELPYYDPGGFYCPGDGYLASGEVVYLLYELCDGSLQTYQSQNGGQSWVLRSTLSDPEGFIVDVAAVGLEVYRLVNVWPNLKVKASSDGGVTWPIDSVITSSFSGDPPRITARGPGQPIVGWRSMAGGAHLEVAESADGGQSWSTGTSLGNMGCNYHDLTADPATGGVVAVWGWNCSTLFASASVGSAQTYSISGTVTWTQSGNPIGGVTVEAKQGGVTIGSDTTDSTTGAYQITGLPAGTYELTASREGYTFVSAANPGQSTIQIQLTANTTDQNFIAVSEPPPTVPDTPDGEVFKGAGWLRYDNINPDTAYRANNVHWNVERSEDILAVESLDPSADLSTQIEIFSNPAGENVDTLVRLDDPERHNRTVNERGPLPSDSPLWPNILAQNDCGAIEDWMEDVDQHYADVIRQAPSVDKFILANEPNHATDEWNYRAEQYAFVFDCYYTRWLEHEFEEGVGRRPHALYVAGPGQEAGRPQYQWQDFLQDEFNNIDRTDGFAMHVYGYATGAGDVDGNSLFKWWLDRTMAYMNNYSTSLPLIISEYNPGATPGDVNEPADWEEWLERTYCWTLSAQQSYPNVQLRGLIYFVDEPSPSRGPDPQWDPVSLSTDETNRRQVWLNLDNDFTGFGFAPSAGDYTDWCLDGSGASRQNDLANLYVSISDDMIQFPQNSPLPAAQSSPPNQIGGVISGTLGVWGDSTVYYVTDDLEIPTGQTLTIEAGTTLVFSPTQRMVVAGQLHANGNTVFPIRFISPDAVGWEGVQVQSSAANSWCTGCSLENIRANGVALQVEAPFAFRSSFIHNVPGGTAISSTVPMTLSHVVIDYVDTGIHFSGQSTQTHSISHITLNRCERGVINQSQILTLNNNIITTCGVAVSTELTGTTVSSYTLFHGNGQNFATEVGSTLTQGPGLLNGPPNFVDFPDDVTLRADSLAVDAADPQSPYDRELGYNGGRADLGAYGNSWRAPQRPPLDQMGVTLVTDMPSLNGLPGKTLSYTLTLQNSGSVTDTYGIVVQPSDSRFDISFMQNYNEDYFFAELVPQEQISVTLWVQIPLTSTLSASNTIAVKAVGRYGVQTETELTMLIPSFQEVNGQVVMEAEHFSGRIDQGNRTWLTQTVLSGYSGEGYVNTSPDTDLQFTTAYTTNSPELDYTLNFTTTGVYTVWLRGYAPNGAGDSVYIGLDNQPVTIVTQFAPRAWTWTRTNTQGNPVTLEITQPGLHTLQLWQREDGLRVDKILLTTDGEYNPSGNGPPESEIR